MEKHEREGGNPPRVEPDVLSRAQGCLLGELAGDALGSLVEFQTPETIRRRYPRGLRRMEAGGTWNTIAGQPTDDSEMALALARTIVELGRYDPEAARKAYIAWLESGPFDCGATVAAGLRGRPNAQSQANGALMRISPLGIYGTFHDPRNVAHWASLDAALTHPHPVCLEANALYACAIARAVRTGCGPRATYEHLKALAKERNAPSPLIEAIEEAAHSPPPEYVRQQGWVLIALRNALWQLLHAPTLEDAVSDTVMRGGDTDTNAAICGALLGAVYGRDALPPQWTECILECRPQAGRPGVRRPRPERYWPVDALNLAEALLVCSRGEARRP